MKKRKRERIKDMVDYVKEHIENVREGFDVHDNQFIIKYRDGQVVYIDGYEIPEKLSLNISKIDYAVMNYEDDGFDTEGKSWFRDFAHGHWDCMKGMVFDPNENLDSIEQWDMYVSNILGE